MKPAAVNAETSSTMIRYEAEDGAFGGSGRPGHADQASNGMIAELPMLGDSTEISVTSATYRTAPLVIRYANGNAETAIMGLYVNGVKMQQIFFPSTGGWTSFVDTAPVQIPLNEGSANKVKLQLEEDANPFNDDVFNADLDYFQIDMEPYGVDLTSSKKGNIFSVTEDVYFNFRLTDFIDRDQDLNLDLKVTDYTGNTVYTAQLSDEHLPADGEIVKEHLTLPITQHGVFNLRVTGKDALNNAELFEKNVSFSVVYPVNPARGNDDIFAAGVHLSDYLTGVDGNLSAMATAGFESERDGMMWSYAETEKGVLRFLPEWDEIVDEALDNGIKPFIILSYGNNFYDEGGMPYSEEGLKAFANYVTFVATHLKGKVAEFEVWNEPNIFNPTDRSEEDYAELLKVAYKALKAVDPDNVVIGGAFGGVDIDWLRKMMETTGPDGEKYGTKYMDALSVHPYSYPVSPEAGDLLGKTQRLKNLLAEYGDVLPLYYTEMGWPTHIGDRGVSEEISGAYAVRANVLSMSAGGIAKLFWYDFQNDGTDVTYNEHNFGLINARTDSFNPSGAKLNYVAYNALANKLAGARFVSSSKPDATLNLYKFHRDSDNQDVLVAWNEFAAKSIGLSVGEGSFKVTDMLGNSADYTTVDGVLSVAVSDNPIYIEGDIAGLETASPSFSVANLAPEAIPGEVFPIIINRSASTADIAGSFELQLPDGWSLQGGSTFAAGTAPIELRVMVPDGEQMKPFNMNIKVKSGTSTLTSIRVQPTVVGPVKVTVEPKSVDSQDWNKWSLDIHLKNHSSLSAIDGTMTIENPAEWATVKTITPIPPGQTGTVTIPVDQPNSKLNQVKLKIELSDGYSIEQQFPVSFLAAEQAVTAPAIDGVISAGEWSGAMRINLNTPDQVQEMADWGGVDDMSAQAYVKWDASKLYFAVDVTDDVQRQTATDDGIWAGDGIQLAFDPARADGIGSMGNHEIGFALSDDHEVQSWRWTAIAGKQPGEFDGADTRIVRDEATKHTIYETAIPWNELLAEGAAVQPGDRFGFSFLINEDDGQGRDGWMEYMGGIGLTKDPMYYGDLVLAPAPSPPPASSTPSGATPSPEPGKITMKPVLDQKGTAMARTSAEALNRALTGVVATEAGKKKVTIQLQTVEGAARYAVELPQSVLKTLDSGLTIEMVTELGTVTLPANLFEGTDGASAAFVGISIGTAEDKNLDDKTKAIVTGKPMIELRATADGKPIDWSNRSLPVTVSIPYKPAAEELPALENLTVVYIDANGTAIPVPSGKYDEAKQSVVFRTTHFSAFAVAYVQKTFADIANSWAKHAIETLAAKGIISGKTDTTFVPKEKMTRADFVMMVIKGLSLDANNDVNFSDVKKESYYYDAIGVAKKMGIVKGTGEDAFNPEIPITREDVAVISARALAAAEALDAEASAGSLSRFVDKDDISAYAASSIAFLLDRGIIQGVPSGHSYKMLPKSELSREEAAKMIYQMYLKNNAGE
ncbi:S-layer homology domain-containing protein [Cohnella hashimotonis]|uniref:S-layer homology domain-containing protein n=1 Tax=Cohnella hashimotonis TaxID=2826895 RepID=A0ABT6TNE0_9BACL|nr:S-layer homology domain-containing protein [Cohnella hashimotonis]MDI4647439.1 S-layer homology domain-containing protein [Cohnella hashimotonis]